MTSLILRRGAATDIFEQIVRWRSVFSQRQARTSLNELQVRSGLFLLDVA